MVDWFKPPPGSECFTTTMGIYCLGDARSLIKHVPPESVDIIITDPPWGVGFDQYDDDSVFFEIEDEMFRVLKRDAFLLFYYPPRNVLKIANLKRFEYTWMMPYLFFTMGSVSRNPLGGQCAYGLIIVMKKGEPKIRRKRRDVLISDELPIIEGKIKERQFKPTLNTAFLLNTFTSPGDVVLDPFAGFGSIPLICELFGRRWVAFEIDPVKYCVAREIITMRKVPDISKLKTKCDEDKAINKPTWD